MLDVTTLQERLAAASESQIGSTVVAGAHAMQRGYADAIEGSISSEVRKRIEREVGITTREARTKRSIEDFSVSAETSTLWVDIKSKDLNSTFSMPNLVSIQRLWKLFQVPNENLVFLFVDYEITDAKLGVAQIKSLRCVPADQMRTECLHVQNLGLGQLQLRPDADLDDLLEVSDGKSLRKQLPQLAADFHRAQLLKVQRELDTWNDRILA